MGKRAIATLLVGLGIAGCGGDGGDSGPADPTATPASGTWEGETSQGLPIRFEVDSGGYVTGVEFGWRARCADGEVHTNTIALGGTRIHYGVFSLGGTLETGGVAHVAGKFDGREAEGTLSRSRGSAFGTNCRATGIDWNAEVTPGTGPDTGSDGDPV